MKNYLLILAFFSCFGFFAQNYAPLIGNSNEWQFTTCHFGCITDIYYTNGDTVVNGKSYKILDGYHYINRNVLLREDVSQKRVYITITFPQFIDDLVLYDFSLTEGDSIQMRNPMSPFPVNGGYFLLDSIRLLPLADGQDYRHFYFSPTASNTQSTDNAIWVEGVGSLSMINAPGGFPNINEVGHLSCSFKNMELRYFNLDSISVCKPAILSTNNIQLPTENVEIFALSERNHFLLSPTKNVQIVTVFDLSGRKTKQLSFLNQDKIQLDLSTIKPGVYILKVDLLSFKSQTFKVVVK